jgi:two-component system, OmpR family, sensor histidine kinase MprB
VSFRARLTLVAAAAVALAIVTASAVVYVVVRNELRAPIDDGLNHSAADTLIRGEGRPVVPPPELGAARVYAQFVDPTGATIGRLPVTKDVVAVAKGRKDAFLTDMHVDGTHIRVLTFPYAGGAVELARSLSDVDQTLHRLRWALLLIGAAGIAVAAALGLIVSRAALAPVRRLTETTEKVTETGDLSERMEVEGRDELSRLAGSFNTMFSALEEANRARRQLVADASHELRTPLTSLRTNIEVLASDRALPPGERERLLTDVVDQLGEMTTLIAELIALARGEQEAAEPEDVRLDLVTADALERTRRNRPGVSFKTDFEETEVLGVPATIERAVANLLDNAAKWSPPGGEVEVAVRNGEVVVRDHGPGIDEEHLPYVFDRFYRAPSARGMPGSGLGLAIVRQVAEAHGGTVVAERADGGGTRVTLRLNGRVDS